MPIDLKPMARLLAGMALAGGVFAASAASAATCGTRACIHVGAFNIKLLGNSGPANTTAEYKEIGRLIADTMDLDVVVLEEINVASPQWASLKSELATRKYSIAFESPFGGERNQHVVVAYRKTSVDVVGPAPKDLDFPTIYSEPSGGCRYENVRPPVMASFKAGQFDFRVIGVHLKSQLPVSGGGPQCDDRIRADQAKRITASIAEPGGEPDVIVLGDFNSSFVSPENDPFRSAGMKTAMADLAPGSGTLSYVGSPKGLIDHIVIKAGDASYVKHSGYVFPLSAADRTWYLNSISDHVPVRAAFYTDQDAN